MKKTLAFKELFIFALPIMFGHLGLMLIGTGDMIVAGRFSKECLAAIGLAISIANPIMMLGLGLLFAISPILAQKRGQGEEPNKYFWSVLLYSFIVGMVTSLMTLLSVEIVPLFHYSPSLTRIIQDYLLITSFSTLGICMYQGMKEFFQSQEKTIPANLIALVGVGVNFFFAYAFVFGAFGMPKLFESGLAWASLSVRAFMGISLFFVAKNFWKEEKKISMPFLEEVSKLGLPITISIFFEVMAFCSVTLFVGKFHEDQVAANNLALNIGSLAFMIPMSIASAVGVKVGHAYGEKNFSLVKTFSLVALLTSFGFSIVMGTIFYLHPEVVLELFTSETDVLMWGKRLLFWVACFQLFDGAQVTLGGILRGLSITRASSVAIFVGYWIIGIPLGYYLGFYGGMEAQGFWVGLALSLALVAMMLGVILKSKMRALLKEGPVHG
jgi:multidrug resistance protein, MATE family